LRNNCLSSFGSAASAAPSPMHGMAHLDALFERTHTLEVITQEKIHDLATLKASLLDAAFKGEL